MDSTEQTRLAGRRISPGGLVTLPFVARLALAFEKGKSKNLGLRISDEGVLLYPAQDKDGSTVVASPRGQLQLSSEAHAKLTEGKKGRFTLEIRKDQQAVLLR